MSGGQRRSIQSHALVEWKFGQRAFTTQDMDNFVSHVVAHRPQFVIGRVTFLGGHLITFCLRGEKREVTGEISEQLKSF